MEGPSLVIATEEFRPFCGLKIRKAEGNTKIIDFQEIQGKELRNVRSWGKHFLMFIDDFTIKIHFLLFGSYRIDDPRENRIPRLLLTFKGRHKIFFYSCSIQKLNYTEENIGEIYDWSTDTMSDQWEPKQALRSLQAESKEMVCDVLLDQNIFTGVGNIIKNEVLYNLRIHPETKVGHLSPEKQWALVKEARRYTLQFYKWKKKFELKKHWKVMRKSECPLHHKVNKVITGRRKRYSFICPICQPKPITRQRRKSTELPSPTV
jgi:endonuclease-8